jgi:23S rRNA (uracil1939-C5)-methyltransferase
MLLVSNPGCRFVYVSCEVETLARDLKDLAKTGFQARQIEAFDMFPQTDNMEWLVVMTR